MSVKDPTVVRVKRLRQPFEAKGPTEYFIGFLCDETGGHVDSPKIGEPIYLTGPDFPDKWIFKTDPIYKIDILLEEWIIQTEQGMTYQIEHQRKLH